MSNANYSWKGKSARNMGAFIKLRYLIGAVRHLGAITSMVWQQATSKPKDAPQSQFWDNRLPPWALTTV